MSSTLRSTCTGSKTATAHFTVATATGRAAAANSTAQQNVILTNYIDLLKEYAAAGGEG